MKASKQCPKCSSLRIGHLSSQPDAEQVLNVDGVPGQRDYIQGKRALGVGPMVKTGLLSHGDVHLLVGVLEAYVCTECGYHESYVAEPEAVSWDQLQDFRWVNAEPEAGGPYR